MWCMNNSRILCNNRLLYLSTYTSSTAVVRKREWAGEWSFFSISFGHKREVDVLSGMPAVSQLCTGWSWSSATCCCWAPVLFWGCWPTFSEQTRPSVSEKSAFATLLGCCGPWGAGNLSVALTSRQSRYGTVILLTYITVIWVNMVVIHF